MQTLCLSVDKIAAQLGVNPETIYSDRKNLSADKVGRHCGLLASEVDQWVKDGTAAQEEADE